MLSKIKALDPHSIRPKRAIALWGLVALTTHKADRFSPAQIKNYLIEEEGIELSRQTVHDGLNMKKGYTNNKGGSYKIMHTGLKFLLERNQTGPVAIIISPDKPFSAKAEQLKPILDSLGKECNISDPYVSLETLNIVQNFMGKERKVKILTQNIQEKVKGSFAHQLQELQTEGYDIEVRVYSKSELHDRYFFDSDAFWFSGNSLKSLGDKESFLVELGEDIRASMEEIFRRRWRASKTISPTSHT